MAEFIPIHYKQVPENFGPLKGANGNARFLGPCGDTMEFWIRINDGFIDAATYTTDGCYYSNKCGATAALMCLGTEPEVAMQFTQEDVLAVAGDIEKSSEHCALLAVTVLKKSILSYQKHY